MNIEAINSSRTYKNNKAELSYHYITIRISIVPKVASPNYFQKSKLILPNIKLLKFCPNCPNWPKLISPI